MNARRSGVFTHEGGEATAASPLQELKRSVMSCLLWEREFYENGETIAARIERLCEHLSAPDIAAIALDARTHYHLRHVPLLLLTQLIKKRAQCSETIAAVIQRPDEIGELLSIYWKNGTKPLAHQLKAGLKKAFAKFDTYELAKWQGRRQNVSLRDAMRLVHPKTKDTARNALYNALARNTLRAADTWEVALSAGKANQATWERLLREKKLGGLALLRNLRAMRQAGVHNALIVDALATHPFTRVLPFRFIAAMKVVPELKDALNSAFLRVLAPTKVLANTSVLVLVDVSGSMESRLSAQSDMERIDAACALAMIFKELSTHTEVYTFASALAKCDNLHGIELYDSIITSQRHSSTHLGKAVAYIRDHCEYDLLVVITDEQAHDSVELKRDELQRDRVLINVASNEHGVSYGQHWTHIDGFSEAVVDFIVELHNLSTELDNANCLSL